MLKIVVLQALVTVQTNQSKIEIDGKKDDGTVTNQGVALYAKNDGINICKWNFIGKWSLYES